VNLSDLKAQLRRHEGVIDHAYQDSEGYWTIGVGRLIDERKGGKLRPDEIDYLLENDLKFLMADLDRVLPWWRELSENRQLVIADMVFNMGLKGLMGFRKALQAVQEGRWADAAREMLDSRWAAQVGSRAIRLADMMEVG
jgi:lysozyme